VHEIEVGDLDGDGVREVYAKTAATSSTWRATSSTR